jgi:Flp pilus assembly protein TadD
LIAGAKDETVFCLDLRNGRPVWIFKASDGVESGPVVYKGRIYFGSDGGRLYCLEEKKAVKKVEAVPKVYSDAEFQKRLGYCKGLNDSGRFGDAVVFCKDLVLSREDSYDARVQMGRAYEGIGEPGPAGREYKLAVQLNPESSECRNALGRYYARIGRIESAKEQFGWAGKLAPGDHRALVNMGKVYLMEGRLDEAGEQYVKACEKNASDGEVMFLGAKLAAARLDFETARKLLKKILEKNPGDARAAEMLKGL